MQKLISVTQKQEIIMDQYNEYMYRLEPSNTSCFLSIKWNLNIKKNLSFSFKFF